MLLVTLPAGLFLALSLPMAPATGDHADHDTRLERLEAELAQLEAARRDDAWLTQERALEIRGLVCDVLADADTRASLLRDGVTAGWDGHPFIASADGAFRLEIEGRLQLRYVVSVQDDAAGVTDTTQGGFETRRVRTIFSGHVLDPSLTYKFQATFARGGGSLILEDAILRKDLGNGLGLAAGQFRAPFTREANVSTFRTTAVERAIAHGVLELTRSQGVEIDWTWDRLLVRGSLNDGDNGANLPALPAGAGLLVSTEFALSARAELLLAGARRQFNDFQGWPDGDPGLLVGGGVYYQRGEFGAGLADRADELRWTFDVSAEFSGAHLYAAVGGRHVDRDSGSETDVVIFVLQGGVFVTGDIEAFARFEGGDDDSADDLTLLTVGATKYWNRHNLKWTTDVGYGFDPVTSTFAATGAGWRSDPAGTDGQVVVRSQVQLMF